VFLHGTAGYRTGKPTLALQPGSSWDEVIAFLRLHMPEYVDQKPRLKKADLLSAAGKIGEENLKTMGLRITRRERFFFDPDKDAAPQRKAVGE